MKQKTQANSAQFRGTDSNSNKNSTQENNNQPNKVIREMKFQMHGIDSNKKAECGDFREN